MTGEPVANRECGPCNACCVHPSISDRGFEKAPGALCHRWAPKTGCTIYETRPGTCRSYFCGWRLLLQLDESWRPDLSNIYINIMPQRPEEQRDVFPEGRTCFVFTLTGELSATHLSEFAALVLSLVISDIPAVLTAAAPPGVLRKGLPLNPLLKPYAAKDGGFAEAFIQVLCASVDMPMAKVSAA